MTHYTRKWSATAPRTNDRERPKAVHSGPFLGLTPSGSPFELMTMEFHYFKDGKIVAARHLEDFFGVHQLLLAAGAKPIGS